MAHRDQDIRRCLTDGLEPAAEASLREHLRACPECRAAYDAQVVLLRALAGNAAAPTPREERRDVERALRAAGLASPTIRPEPSTRWWEFVQAGYWRLGAAAVACLLLIAVALQFVPDRPVPSGTITRARGLMVAGVEAREGAVVHAGEDVEVGPKGFAEIALERGGTLRLFPHTTARMEGPGTGLDLGAGKVWCQITPAPADAPAHPGPRFRVQTDRGEARVMGTSFVVEKLPRGEMEVRVLSGRVAVEDAAHNGRVEVVGGQKTRVDRGAPGPLQPYGGEDAGQWSLLDLFKKVGRAFRSLFE